MKLLLFNLLILLFVAGIGAQRARTSSSDASSETSTKRSRGRVKFTVPSDISEADLVDAAAPIERSKEVVKNVDRKISRASSKPYEVKEVFDDIPNLNARKIHKPRVITETRFEAANAPKKPLYVPLPLPEDEILPEDLLANFAPQSTKASTERVSLTTAKLTTATAESSSLNSFVGNDAFTEEILPITTNLGQSSEITTLKEQSSSTENEIKKLDATTPDIKKKQIEPVQIVTPVTNVRKTTRVQARPRIQTSTTEESHTQKTRTRTRPARRQDNDSLETTSGSSGTTRSRTRPRQDIKSDDVGSNRPSRPRPIRKRLDIADITGAGSKERLPSLFSAEDTLEEPSKSRTGRKVSYRSVNENESVQGSGRRSSFRRRTAQVEDKTTNSIETSTQDVDNNQSNTEGIRSFRRGSSRNINRNNRGRATETHKVDEPSTSSPNLNRRVSVSRGRKIDRVERKNVEAVDFVRNDKVIENTNRNEVIKPKSNRSRSPSVERIEVKEEPAEFIRARSKAKPIENEIPSVATALPIRSRRVELQSKSKPEVQSESKLEEKVVSTTQDGIITETRRNVIRNRVDTRRNKATEETTPIPEVTTPKADNRRRNFSRKVNTIEPPIKETSTEAREAFRSRPRTRYIPPIIDEQKLEVLPLFESEVKTVAPIVRKRPNTHRETLNLASSSEHQIKIGKNNDIQADSPRVRLETKTERLEQVQVRTSKPIIKESVETKISEVVTKRKIGRQVVRKVKVNKSGNDIANDNEKLKETNDNQKVVKLPTTARGHKRNELKNNNKKQSTPSSSEEEVGDSDNYPEPFKALIQAKLAKQTNGKGSRPHKVSNEDAIAKSTERIVTSSRVVPTASAVTSARTSTASATQTASLKANDDDNELVPHFSTTNNPRPTRRRFSLTTKYDGEDANSRYTKRPSYSTRKVIRSTVSPSHVSVITEVSTKVRKHSRYHARFSAAKNGEKASEKNLEKLEGKDVEIATAKNSRNYSPKPPRGVYSIRNGSKKRTGKLDSPLPTQQVVPGTNKASRYSARYRSDIFSRAGSTRPTSAPAYIPTVPTVTPSPVKSGVEDNISGMEVISIDDPVNTIPSDSLINGELLSPPNPYKNPSSKLVPASLVTKDGGPTTASIPKSIEKPVSIIERIIYSITAISTASPDLTIDLINDGPTKASAILKIPSKTTKEDVTFDALAQQRQPQTVTINEIKPLTTDKPTTIIERILSSISAIQASSTTERTDTQVGNSLNTISTTFKPLSNKRVSSTVSTTVSTTLSPSSTPQDALDVIENISSEQSLQQRTISKLLALLKSITPDTPSTENVVVVTPKVTSFTSATSQTGSVNRDVEVFNISSNVISGVPERQSEPPSSMPSTPDTSNTVELANDIENRFGSTPASPTSDLNVDSSLSTAVNTDDTTSPIPEIVTLIPASSQNESTEVTDVTTPDLLQNTIAQNTADVESTTSNLFTSDTNSTVKINSRLPDIISISDFLATLDTLNSIEPTTSSSTITTASNTLRTGTQTNENIESTTPSFTNESATSTNTITSVAAESAELIVVNKVDPTTMESANLITDTLLTTTEQTPQETAVFDNGNNSLTAKSPSSPLIGTSPEGLSDVDVTTLKPDQSSSTANSEAGSTDATTTAPDNLEIVTTGSPPIISRFSVQESATEVNEMLNIIDSVSISSENIRANSNSSQLELQEAAVTTELPSTTSSVIGSDITVGKPESSNTIPGPTSVSSSAILAMISRLLEITGRTETLASLTLEQTTVTPADSSADLVPTTSGGGTTFAPLSTIDNFEVSPGSVTIFSANDISSMFIPTDDGTTVTISSRSFLTTSPPNTEPSVTDSTSELLPSTVTNSVTPPSVNFVPTLATTAVSADSSAALKSTTVSPPDNSTALKSTSASDNSTLLKSDTTDVADLMITTTLTPDISADVIGTTNSPSENPADIVTTTTLSATDNPVGDIDSTTQVAMTETSTESMLPVTDVTTLNNITESSNNNTEALRKGVSNETSVNVTKAMMQTNSSNTTSPSPTISDRAGGQLAIEPEPVQNDLQVSSESPDKDFFVFGILPNNTILRKRPNKYPNKNVPFVIVGVYPNNTVVQKFPNGTLIPEEPIIQVSGFDTRENPPTLPEITSNQVTQDSSPPDDNTNRQTGDLSQNSASPNDGSRAVTVTPSAATTIPPPTATLPILADASGGTPSNGSQAVIPKLGDRSRDIEEVNIEENTISNNGNNKPEKIVEQTTQRSTSQAPTTSAPSTSQAPPTVAPTTQATTTSKPATTTSGKRAPVIALTVPPLPTTTLAPAATPLAAIRIDDLQDGIDTTIASIDMTTNRFRSNEVLTTTVPTVPTTTTTTTMTTTATTATTRRYTNIVTTVVPFSETIQLTIRPTTPYLIQRIIGNITGTSVRIGDQPTTNLPTSTITTDTPTTQTITIPPPTVRARSRVITTTETSTPAIEPMTTPATTTLTQAPTTQPPTTTNRNRGRSRFSVATTEDAFVRTVTVTPSTVSTPYPTDFPIRTTFLPRRYTQTPTTINVPSKITSFTPTTGFTNIPTVTEQNFLSTTGFGPNVGEITTVFPIYTNSFDGTTQTSTATVQPPSAPDTTTNTPPTFASTQRTRQRTTTPLTTSPPNFERLAELRVRDNFGELSTTSDFTNPTTLSPIVSTTVSTTLQTTLKTINSKVRQLTEQQKKDLEELAKLEKEQEAILQQLAFLTRLNLAASPKPTRSPSNLAGRVLDFAAERNKQPPTENPSSLNLLYALTRQNEKPAEPKPPSLEDILKQLNVNPNSVTPSSLSSTYGKSTDAILAALLKEQGIQPSTPKALGDQLKTTTPVPRATTTKRITTTRKRVTTTPRPGPIMQGLNWLLNALAPTPTTKPPSVRKRVPTATIPRVNTISPDVELISSQPTELTPVVVTAPPKPRAAVSPNGRSSSRFRKPVHSLSEDEIKNLVNQLEAAQKDPSKAENIDLASFGFAVTTPKSTTLLADNAVQITNSGRVGTNSKLRVTQDSSATEVEVVPLVYTRGISTTPIPSGVSNSIIEDLREETTVHSRRTTVPPLQLNPVPGIDGEGETQVRGQLINAAVNVTRAISQFLGSAIQGAAQSFQSFIGSGSRQVGNYFTSSSLTSSRPG